MTEKQIKELAKIVDHQANMVTLWPGKPASVCEHLMTSALRHLHAVLEGDWDTAEMTRKEYWDLESEM